MRQYGNTGAFAKEGMLWVSGCFRDQAIMAQVVEQVDTALLQALRLCSANDSSAQIEQVRWFGDIRAREHRFDLRLRMGGPVQQMVRQITSLLRPVLAEAVTDQARLCEFACIIVDPGAPAQALHYDTPLNDDGSGLITVFIPLQKVTSAMGATCLLPGTHTSAEAHQALADDKAAAAVHATGAAFLGVALMQDPARNCQVFAGSAGDAMMMDSRTLHCGSANTSTQRRRLLYMTFHVPHNMPGGSTYSLLEEYAGKFVLGRCEQWKDLAYAHDTD